MSTTDSIAATTTFPDLPRVVTLIAISGDGRWVVGQSGREHSLWAQDLETNRQPRPTITTKLPQGPSDRWTQLVINTDGHWAAAIAGSSAYLWNLQERAVEGSLFELPTHRPTSCLAFSPDGQWLVTGHEDGTLRLWPLELKELVNQACASAGRNLRPEEWQTYFGNQPYRKTVEELP